MNRAQKQELAFALMRAAADEAGRMFEEGYQPDGVTYEEAVEQFAQWLKALPGTNWDMRLPLPKS